MPSMEYDIYGQSDSLRAIKTTKAALDSLKALIKGVESGELTLLNCSCLRPAQPRLPEKGDWIYHEPGPHIVTLVLAKPKPWDIIDMRYGDDDTFTFDYIGEDGEVVRDKP